MQPSFFIVGAPRCGTTALARYLKRHPQVCFSVPKEPHYLAYAPPEIPLAELEARYLELFFPHRAPKHLLLGDGSVSYLYSDSAIRHALALDPTARFIVLVRDPLELLPSYHLRMLYTLDEDQADFATAWSRQAERARGVHVPRDCRDPRFLQYTEIGRLAARIERLWELAGRERCLVIVHDDFVADTAAVYAQVLAFLGLEHDGRTTFSRKLESRTFRSHALHRLLYRPPVLIAKAVLNAKLQRNRDRKRSLVKRVRSRLLVWNTLPLRPRPLPPAVRGELRKTFAADVELLGKLLERDFSHWSGRQTRADGAGPDQRRSISARS